MSVEVIQIACADAGSNPAISTTPLYGDDLGFDGE